MSNKKKVQPKKTQKAVTQQAAPQQNRNRQQGKTQQGKTQRKKSNLPLVIAAVVIVCAAILVVVLTKNSGTDTTDAGNSASKDTQVIKSGENLVIPIDEISETVQFYPIEVDGTEMEVIAVKDSKGNIRTAFNTCQICYSSGRGYYVQDGNEIVCQNCRNRFTVDQIEVEVGGCNPYPIFDENKTVTEDSILISYDYLKNTTEVFANWKN